MPHKNELTLTAFIAKFNSEKACHEYLVKKRWPNGFVCPSCKGTHGWLLADGKYECSHCHKQVSATAGTILHRSHIPLTKWFLAFYLVMGDKRGISAVELSKSIGVTYKTAWYMLYRIRTAMSQRDERYRLEGKVEFDNAYIGGPTVGKKRGCGTDKVKVFCALSLNADNKPLFLKLKTTKDMCQKSVAEFAKSAIKQGAIIHTDGYRSYKKGLDGYEHQPKVYKPNTGLLHWLHVMISNAKAFILGTFHGLPKKNLDLYLSEFCFRFNRRNMNLFERLVVAVSCSFLPD